MKIKFIGRGSYFASPFHFTERERVHEVDKKLGQYLIKNKNFQAVLEDEIKQIKAKTQKEVEEKASVEKKKYDKTKKTSKKTTDKE